MSTKVTALAIFLLSLICLMLLPPQNPGNVQVVTRLALVVSILDDHRLDIGQFGDWTTDKARVGGKIYADKTPGHPLLAIPALALAKLTRQIRGDDLNPHDTAVFFSYAHWATIGCNCLISALALSTLFLLATSLGASRAGALFATFTLGFATPFFGWSMAFFAHSVSGSFLLFCLALVLAIFPKPVAEAPVDRPWLAAILGVLLGYACVIDLTTAPAVCVLGLFAVWRAWRSHSLWRFVLPLALGGLVGVLPLLVYDQLAFGSPLHLGYADTDFDGMQRGFFGVTWPDPAVLLKLLIGLYRGLLPLSPILILVPAGILAMSRLPDLKGPAIVAASIIAIYFWITSGYYYWHGGWSTGPRHLVPMLPIAALALAFAWPARLTGRVATAILLALSLFMSLCCALAGMFAEDTYLNPIFDWILPRTFGNGTWILGLPAVAVWIAFAVLIIKAEHGKRAPRTDSTVGPLPSAEQTGRSGAAAASG